VKSTRATKFNLDAAGGTQSESQFTYCHAAKILSAINFPSDEAEKEDDEGDV
jgi:hypothetical protein